MLIGCAGAGEGVDAAAVMVEGEVGIGECAADEPGMVLGLCST
jgi:hypothetical protein